MSVSIGAKRTKQTNVNNKNIFIKSPYPNKNFNTTATISIPNNNSGHISHNKKYPTIQTF